MTVEKGQYKQLAVRIDTHNLIVKDCVKEFLKNNPTMEGMEITQEYIARRIALAYLDRLG